MSNTNTTKAKKERVYMYVEDVARSEVRMYEHGSDPRIARAVLTMELNKLPQNIRDMLALVGLKTVPQQRASNIPAGPAKLAHMQKVLDHWAGTGEWELPREGGPRNIAPVWLAAAIAKAMPGASQGQIFATIERDRERLSGDDWKAFLVRMEKYKPAPEVSEGALDLSSL